MFGIAAIPWSRCATREQRRAAEYSPIYFGLHSPAPLSWESKTKDDTGLADKAIAYRGPGGRSASGDLVFAAAPYGVMGVVLGLWVMNTSFGFMAFLGIASLIGVIVSHVIVLFDFIEEMHAKAEPFETAAIDAGIRLRPVTIPVGATVLALFPLA